MSTYTPPPPPHHRTDAPAPTPPGRATRWTAGRIAATILGALLMVVSFGLGLTALAVAVADTTQRDANGYLMSDPIALTAGGYALTSSDLEIQGTRQLPHRILGDAKVTATPAGDSAVFVGVARTSDARDYLDGVEHAEVLVFSEDPVYSYRDGTAEPTEPPTASDIWIVESSGTGTQTVTWPVENGNWTVVVMNADGSEGVSAGVASGATVPAIMWIYGGLFVAAGVCLLLGIVVLVVTLRRVSKA